MERTEITIDMLTDKSVSIKTQKYFTHDGKEYPEGEPHRVAYVNSESGRKKLQEEQPKNIIDAVLAIWGATAVVE